MASRKLTEEKRNQYMEFITEAIKDHTEVLKVGSNKLAFPDVIDGEEMYVVVTVQIPTGSRDGTVYDGHFEATEYQAKLETDKIKRKEQAEAKSRKIAKDQARRAKTKKEKEG